MISRPVCESLKDFRSVKGVGVSSFELITEEDLVAITEREQLILEYVTAKMDMEKTKCQMKKTEFV